MMKLVSSVMVGETVEVAEIAKFNPEEVRGYEKSLKYYRDLQNSMDTARDEGREEGIEIGTERGIEIGKEQGIEIGKEQGIEIGKEQGKEEGIEMGKERVALNLLQMGMSEAQVLAATGLTKAQLARLKEG